MFAFKAIFRLPDTGQSSKKRTHNIEKLLDYLEIQDEACIFARRISPNYTIIYQKKCTINGIHTY